MLAVTLPVVAVIKPPAVTFPFVLCSVTFVPACNALAAEIPVDALMPIEPSVPAITVSLVVTDPFVLVNVTFVSAFTLSFSVTSSSPVTVTFLFTDSIAFSAVTLPDFASIYTASSAFAVLPSTIFPDAVSTEIAPPAVVAVRAAVSAVVIFPDPV